MTSHLSETSKASRLKHKFGSDSQLTKVFENFDQATQTFFLAQVKLESGELPILGFYSEPSRWFFATTRRIVWSIPTEDIHELRHQEIEEMGWSSGPPGLASREKSSRPDYLIYTDEGEKRCKTASPWLYVLDSSGERHEVFLEPGSPLCAVWNSIKLLSAGWNRPD